MTLSIIILILVGFLSAIIGSLVGIGGGIIIVPTLIYFGVTLNILGALHRKLQLVHHPLF